MLLCGESFRRAPNEKTPATTFVVITGAKVNDAKIIHHIVHDGLHDDFFQSRQIESFQEVLLHSSEDFRLCVHVGVVFHRAVQVVAVA